MGLFKFLKREAKSYIDIPPPPPVGLEEDSDIQPEFPGMEDLPPLPSEAEEENAPTFESALKSERARPPAIKSIQEEEESPMPSNLPARDRSAFEYMEDSITREEAQPIHLSGPIFVRADSYKLVLDELLLSKNLLKESESILLRLDDIKASKDKEFEVWRGSLEDIERKLLWIDRELFGKG